MPEFLTHPLTGLPITPVGFRKNGRAIWPIMGGSDSATDDATTGSESATDGTATETDATASGAEAEAASTDSTEGAIDWEDRAKAQQKVNRDLERKLKERTSAETELAALQAKLDGKEAEHTAAQEAQRVKDEALAGANERILKANVRAEAAKKLTDPADALLYINLSDFEVGSDGEVDSSAIAQAVDDLLTSKPYLAAQGTRFQGSADGGARNGAATASQLTKADADRMTPEEINEAREAGRFNNILGIKN